MLNTKNERERKRKLRAMLNFKWIKEREEWKKKLHESGCE